jgi:hypothetical protein
MTDDFDVFGNPASRPLANTSLRSLLEFLSSDFGVTVLIEQTEELGNAALSTT